MASVYDSLGFPSPFSLRRELIIQRLWTENLTWDELVSLDLRREVSLRANELQDLASVQVRRLYSEGNEFHEFGDASPAAYACAACVECRYETGDPEVSLVMYKSRIAPKDAATLPRLELRDFLRDFLLGGLDK